MKKQNNRSLSITTTPLKDSRDFIRFMTVILFIPWFGWITNSIFGFVIEFEAELAVLITFMFFGTFWCGWLCPFGNLSYFVSKIGQTLFPAIQIKIPERIDRLLRYLKYLFLAGFIYVIFSEKIDYFFGDHMEMYFSTGFTTAFFKFKKYAILLIPLLIPRFFCKYLCFQKAAYNIINNLLPFTVIRRDNSKCIKCNRCNRTCPMGIDISACSRIKGNDCIGCFSCLDKSVCPEKANALSITFLGVKIDLVYFIIVVIFLYYMLTAMIIL